MRPSVRDQPGSQTPAWLLSIWRSPWLWMALVVVFFCIPLFWGLGNPDLDNDESIYSFAVDTMLKDGDWLTPKSVPDETRAFLEKPPLKFWLAAAPLAMGWLPSNEFGLRFVDALMGGLAFLYVFGIGRKLGGPVAGLASVMLLFAHRQLLFEHGLRTNNMEAAVVLAYCGGVYHFLAWRSPNPDMKRHIVAMALYFVLGFMTKFVAGLFLPLILVLAAAATHQDRVRVYRDWRTFAMAALLAAALIAPWFVYQYLRVGDQFFAVIFSEHVMKRFTAYLDPHHLQPWNYYLTELWRQLRVDGAWIATLGGTLILLRRLRHRSTEAVLLVIWFVLPMAIISSTTSKVYHYIFPFLPPVALAGGLLVGAVARVLYGVLERPVDAFDRARRRLLGRWMDVKGWQIAATVAGFAALTVAAATYGMERLSLHLGPLVFRSSVLWRPIAVGVTLLVAGAPAVGVRAVIVGALVLGLLPGQGYRRNIAFTTSESAPYRSLRDCLAPVIAAEVAKGKPAPGVWAEPADYSHRPFYYLRNLGPYQKRDHPSNQTVVMHLIVPDRYRPVLLSPTRYDEVLDWIKNDRAFAVGRASTLSGVDTATLEESLDQTVVGVTLLEKEPASLLMPGPYAVCGQKQIHLTAR